ncbi:uncharacterized protein LOC110113292 isoform X2 [Dendrobium catenatum]|uniref:Methyl-CpG-binding domain-containing protein 9 n=2 Tax=Dendrobium catenatum TaxID=906689 RepID=A0A2I0VKG6_9ASPA|nr:uncharacterized protein LOC110113292 isoform X2 [Dendrobium catenatum]XP_020701484.1 uncharacterized protein LOC110113292 isoform X2 [Dendrobium catenatum]PKU63909.1 Methyl-CpG-binding domain-containing protein 9 [Dendrobium catenatum]
MHKEASFLDDSLTRTGDILTQGFLPDSVSTALTFLFGHGNQQNMNSSCNWSNFGENWQKSRKSDEHKLNSCKRGISVVENNNISSNIEEISRSSFDSCTIKKMNAASSPIKDGFVYKRRKMQRNTDALLSGKNAAEVTEENALSDFNLSSSDYHLALHEDSSDDVQAAVHRSSDCQDNERPSFSGRHHLDVHTYDSQHIDYKNLESVKKSANNDQISARDVSHSAKEFTNKLCCSSTGNYNAVNSTFAASKSRVPCASILSVAGEHGGDCSTSGAISLESLDKFESPEEMCIYVLKRHGLLGKNNRNSAFASSENLGSVGSLFSPCKICGISENAVKMLICDDCEEAFHLSCCRPKIKRLPRDEWYCQSCFIKKRKHLVRKNMGTSSGNVGDISESGGPIASMLRDLRPHRSRVRIGEDFQVEVPDWSGTFSNSDDYFGEPKEMDHADCCSFEGWSWSKSSKSCSIGNWLQCKEEDDNGNICGKWRRAPLFSVQTDDWDCFCAVLWDPVHADCAVPQELDTEEVLKHLKYVEMLKSRLNNRVKPV